MDAPAERLDLARERPFRLGPLDIDPVSRRVAHDDGREQFLEPRVMQVFVALARAGGRILSRDELLATCWRGVMVGEDALNRVVSRLRRLSASFGAFEVETITKVGYRLVPWAGGGRTIRSASGAASICVLPFANIGDDPQQACFSDGVTEDVITELSKTSSLHVLARATPLAHRDVEDLIELARRLGVTHVLEGSVRRAGDRVRITAQLIDGASGGHIWAERYDRDLGDIFAVQDEISQSIVTALKERLAPGAARG